VLRAAFVFAAALRRSPERESNERREEKTMRRAAILALMLIAVLVPLTGIGHADMRSDQALQQAP